MKYKITLQNKVYEVEVEQGNAVLLSEYEAKAPVAAAPVAAPAAVQTAVAAPVAAAPVGAGKPIPAPLGGVIVTMKCKVGDTVKQNDVIAIVEAMKMENDITAPFGGKVVAVRAEKGKTIVAGDVLVELA